MNLSRFFMETIIGARDLFRLFKSEKGRAVAIEDMNETNIVGAVEGER